MARKKAGRAGLNRERERRREFDRLKAEQRAAGVVPGVEGALPPEPDGGSVNEPAAWSARADQNSTPAGGRLPGQSVECAWCGSSTPVKGRGPLPRFCSANCRHRAWEMERAARAGRAAVTTVDRFVATYPDSSRAWVEQLSRLAADVREGRLDVEVLVGPLDAVYAAISYRPRNDQGAEPW